MRISCPSCQTTYNVDDARFSQRKPKMRCARCQHVFTVEAPSPSVPTPPPPAAPPPVETSRPTFEAIPLPGFEPVTPSAFDEDVKTTPSNPVMLEGWPDEEPSAQPEVPKKAEDVPWENESTLSANQMIPLESFPIPQEEFQPVPLPGAGNLPAPPTPPPEAWEGPALLDPQEFIAQHSQHAAAADAAEPNVLGDDVAPSQSNLLDFLEKPIGGPEVTEETSESPPSATKRFHVRGLDGEALGEFEARELLRMVAEGALTGAETCSGDQKRWVPLSSLSADGTSAEDADASLELETLERTRPAKPSASKARTNASMPSVQRLKEKYDGRIAVVAAAKTGVLRAKLKRLLPYLAGGSLLLAFVGAGVTAGVSTHYGYFWIKYLFPARVAEGSSEAAQLALARKALSEGTFRGLKQAKDAAAGVLSQKEYPEARAVWAQTVFRLQRLHRAAEESELKLAEDSLQGIELLGRSHPEVLKALAEHLLWSQKPQEAVTLLQSGGNRDDAEMKLLEAEAHLQAKAYPAALEALSAVVGPQPNSARAWHTQGMVYRAQLKADKASGAFQKALKAHPDHFSSAVLLAEAQASLLQDDPLALATLEGVFEKKARPFLGPTEISLAHTVKGEIALRRREFAEAGEQFDLALRKDATSTRAHWGRAQTHFARREYEPARVHYQAAYEAAPGSLDYAAGYLNCLISLGKMVDAARVVEAGLKRFPNHARMTFLHGRFADTLDKTQEAETHYRQAIALDSELVEAPVYLAHMLMRFRRLEEVAALLNDTRFERSALYFTAKGEWAFMEGRLDDAAVAFKKALELDENMAEAHVGLSKVNLEQGEVEDAKSGVEKALELDPTVKEGHLQKGLILWKEGQLEPALAEMELAKKMDPSSSRVLVQMGAIKFELGDYNGAETVLGSALHQAGYKPEAYFHLARVQSRRLQHATAIENMRRALELTPKRVDYHFEMGRILSDAGKIKEAIEAWKTTLTMDSQHAEAIEALGHAYFDLRRYDESIAAFEQALRVSLHPPRVYAALGDSHFFASHWDEAIASYAKSLKLDATQNALPYKIARAYSEKGAHGQAIDWYRKAAVADASNTQSWYYLGYAYKEKGRRKEAVQAFATYLKKKPEAEERQMLENEIYDLEHDR